MDHLPSLEDIKDSTQAIIQSVANDLRKYLPPLPDIPFIKSVFPVPPIATVSPPPPNPPPSSSYSKIKSLTWLAKPWTWSPSSSFWTKRNTVLTVASLLIVSRIVLKRYRKSKKRIRRKSHTEVIILVSAISPGAQRIAYQLSHAGYTVFAGVQSSLQVEQLQSLDLHGRIKAFTGGLVKLEEALATFIASNPSKISIAGLIINDLPTNYGPVEGISPISWKETIGNSLVSIAESIQLFVPLIRNCQTIPARIIIISPPPPTMLEFHGPVIPLASSLPYLRDTIHSELLSTFSQGLTVTIMYPPYSSCVIDPERSITQWNSITRSMYETRFRLSLLENTLAPHRGVVDVKSAEMSIAYEMERLFNRKGSVPKILRIQSGGWKEIRLASKRWRDRIGWKSIWLWFIDEQ